MKGETLTHISAMYVSPSASLIEQGAARFLSPHKVRVDSRTITTRKAVIATGSRTAIPEIEGLEQTGFIFGLKRALLRDVRLLPASASSAHSRGRYHRVATGQASVRSAY